VPDLLEAHFVRSDLAHARIASVDVAAAGAVPGVVAVYAAADLPDLPDVPPAPRSAAPQAMRRPSLARDRVRFAGEAVAVVLAENRYAAEDGGAEVAVDLDPLPAIVGIQSALAPGASTLFDGLPNAAGVREFGAAVDDVLAAAPLVVRAVAKSPRLAPTSIEPRAILAVPDDDGTIRVWCSHQAPHRLRAGLSAAFDLPPARIRVTVPDVGGAFGGKSQLYPEYLVVVALARRHRRPVRWLEDRREALIAATHGRGQTARLALAADADGRILALDAEIDADVGAYPHVGDFVAAMTAWVISGPYRIPRLHVRQRGILTNAAPTASYRGAGRPEAAYALERAVDDLARATGLDPIEVRRRNFVPPDGFPYTSPTGAVYDSGRYESALLQAAELAGYDGWRQEQRRRRAAGTGPLLGIGVASWIERSGGEGGSTEYARVEVLDDGTVLGRVGSSAQGQGHEISFAQVLADAVGVDLETVRVRFGDTGLVAEGTGTFGSRSMQVGGSALHLAGTAVRQQARSRAASALGCAVEHVRQSGSSFTRADGTDGVTLAALAAPGPRLGPLQAEETFASPQAFPFGSYVCVVEVDPDVGGVRVLRLAAVDDCGVVVNPSLVEGQVLGSIVQGLGQALYEQVRYDETGQPLTSTLLDYSVPTAAELPEIVLGEHVTPNPNVPLGTKGAGESGCIGTPPAVLNAVRDALHGHDTSALNLPLTAEKIWACCVNG
jgi:carbon-monoxide dehydrogenase large subunit